DRGGAGPRRGRARHGAGSAAVGERRGAVDGNAGVDRAGVGGAGLRGGSLTGGGCGVGCFAGGGFGGGGRAGGDRLRPRTWRARASPSAAPFRASRSAVGRGSGG